MKTFADFGIEISPGENRALCPQCSPNRLKSYEKCLSVDQEEGLWFCHHCSWSGSIGVANGEGQEVAKKHFAKPHFRDSGVTDKRSLSWLKSRGLSENTIADAKISSEMSSMPGKNGWSDVMCVKFPYFMGGEVVNVKYRTGDKRFRQEIS